MQDSHPSLDSTKTLVYFWFILVVYTKCWLLYINLESTENYMDKFFEHQGKMFLNIEKILVKISEK